MKLKGCYFALTPSGIQETYQESGEEGGTQFLVACDAVISGQGNAPSGELGTLAKLAERFIRDYLERCNDQEISEATLVEAFEYGHEQIRRYSEHRDRSLAVSALAICVAPDAPDTLIAACVGDIRLYRIRPERCDPLLVDPKNPILDPHLTPEERFQCTQNALGLSPELQVYCRRLPPSPFQRYVATGYGVYDQLDKQALVELGLRPHDVHHGCAPTLNGLTDLGHAVRLCTFTYGSIREAKNRLSSRLDQKIQQTEASARASKRKSLAVVLSVLTCAVVLPVLALNLKEKPKSATLKVAEARVQVEGIDESRMPDSSPSSPVLEEDQVVIRQSEIDDLRGRVSGLEQELAAEGAVAQDKTRQVFDLRRQLEAALRPEHEALFKEMTRQVAEKNRLIENLHASVASYQQNARDLHGRVRALESEQMASGSFLDQLEEKDRTIASLGAEKIQLLREMESSRNEIQTARQRLEETEALRDTCQKQDQQLATLESQKAALESQLSEKEKDVQVKLARSQDKIRFLEQNMVLLDDMKRQLDEREDQLAAAHQQRMDLESEMAANERRMDFLQNNSKLMGQLQEQLNESQQALHAMRKEVAEFDRERRDYEGKLNFLQASIETLESREDLWKSDQNLLRQLKQEQEQWAQAQQSYQDRIASLEDSIRVQEKTKNDEIQELRIQVAALDGDSREQLSSLARQLQSEQDRAKESMLANEGLIREKEELLTQLDQLRNANEELHKAKQQISYAKGRLGEWEQERHTLLAENQHLNRQLDQLQVIAKRQEEKEGQQQALAKEIRSLNGEIQHLASRNEELTATLHQSKEENSQARRMLAEQRMRLDAMEANLAQSSSDKERLQHQLMELASLKGLEAEQKINLHLKEVTDLQLQNESLRKQVQELTLQEQENSEIIDHLQDLRDDYLDERDGLMARLDEMAASKPTEKDPSADLQIAELSKDLATLEDAYNEELRRSRQLEASLTETRARLENSQNQGSLAEEVQLLKRSLSEKEKELQNLQSTLHAQSESGFSLEEELAQLRDEIDLRDNELLSVTEREQHLQEELRRMTAKRDSLLNEHNAIADRLASVHELEERFKAEHRLRVQKEKRFAELAASLHDQREAYIQMEASRRALMEEIALLRRQQAVRTEAPSQNRQTTSTRQAVPSQRTHTVRSGETLSGLSLKYYGTTARWGDIFEANRHQVSSTDQIQVGMTLVIPQ